MRLKIIHLLSCPEQERERISVMSIKTFAREAGIDYIQVINEPYRWPLPPAEESLRPDELYVDDPVVMQSSLGKYGCYRAHKDALLEHMNADVDGILLFECDAYIYYEFKTFLAAVNTAITCSFKLNLDMFTLGMVFMLKGAEVRRLSNLYLTDYIRQTHAVFIPSTAFDKIRSVFESGRWDTIDFFYSHHLDSFGGFTKSLCFQVQGDSLLDGVESERKRRTRLKITLEGS